MTNTRWLAPLLAVALFAGSLQAQDIEQRSRWQDLPQSLVGQDVKVTQTDQKKVSGKVSRLDAGSLKLESRKGAVTVPRPSTSQLQFTKRERPRGRILGVALAAAAGIVLTGIAGVYKKNEGG